MNGELRIPKKIKVWAEELPRLAELIDSEYGEALTKAYEELNTDVLYQSFTHGQGHIERTMLFGALIAQNEGLSAQDTAMLLKCCSYHDIGRVDDSYDLDHGIRSARMIGEGPLRALFDDCALAQAAISAHAVPDSDGKKFADAYGKTDPERLARITACLKDADNLDRVRIYDLDIRHLRHELSKKMEPLAEAIFAKYIAVPTVLCYGDSNTYGYNSSTCSRYPDYMRWPDVLQRKLGSGYKVIAEGLNGRTTAYPKWGLDYKSGLYALKPVLESHYPVDTVIFMLGTNDCAAALNLNAETVCASMENLALTAKSFLRELQGYEPQIILIAPPPIEESVFEGPFFEEMNEKSLTTSAAIPALYEEMAEKNGFDFLNLAGVLHFSKIDSEHLTPFDHHRLAGMLMRFFKEED